MGRIGLPEILIIAVVFLILFGSQKLPEFASALGKAIKEFKKAAKDTEDDVKKVVEEKKDESKKV